MFSSLTLSATESGAKPGPGNTGCRIPTGNLVNWPHSYTITGGPMKLQGYKFTSKVLLDSAKDIEFIDCYFSGTPAASLGCPECPEFLVEIEKSDTVTSGITFSHCSFENSRSSHLELYGSINPPANHLVEYCQFSRNCKTAIHFHRDGTIRNNWFHSLGFSNWEPASHGDPINARQWDCGTGGGIVVQNNNIDEPFNRLKLMDGTTITSCYGEQYRDADEGIVFKCKAVDTCNGDISITDNWINCANTVFNVGVVSGKTLNGDITISRNKIGRDFGLRMAGGGGGGTQNGTYTVSENEWQDGKPIPNDVFFSINAKYNRYGCTHATPGSEEHCPGVEWCCEYDTYNFDPECDCADCVDV